jgi:hypothetical protein
MARITGRDLGDALVARGHAVNDEPADSRAIVARAGASSRLSRGPAPTLGTR